MPRPPIGYCPRCRASVRLARRTGAGWRCLRCGGAAIASKCAYRSHSIDCAKK